MYISNKYFMSNFGSVNSKRKVKEINIFFRINFEVFVQQTVWLFHEPLHCYYLKSQKLLTFLMNFTFILPSKGVAQPQQQCASRIAIVHCSLFIVHCSGNEWHSYSVSFQILKILKNVFLLSANKILLTQESFQPFLPSLKKA